MLWISKEGLRRQEQSEVCTFSTYLSPSAFVVTYLLPWQHIASQQRGCGFDRDSFYMHLSCFQFFCSFAFSFALWLRSSPILYLTYSCCVLLYFSFSCFVLFIEKPSTVLWTRALLPKQHCQHTPTRCWARTTQKMTSLFGKQVENGGKMFISFL